MIDDETQTLGEDLDDLRNSCSELREAIRQFGFGLNLDETGGRIVEAFHSAAVAMSESTEPDVGGLLGSMDDGSWRPIGEEKG